MVEGSSQWTKFGSKVGSPLLSILSKEIQETISNIQYVPGKVYKFVDDKFEYKILVEDVDGKNKFDFYIKPKDVVAPIIQKKKFSLFGLSPGILIVMVSIIIVGISLIALSPFLFW